ncbi:MAG: YjbH domain-containing protein [Simkaniaceae bacterium]
MRLSLYLLLLCFSLKVFSDNWLHWDTQSLLRDLQIVEKVNRDIADTLPIFYNNIAIAGYIAMPSARMAEEGTLALQAADSNPYTIFGLNFQMFSNIELAGTYRVFRGVEDACFKGKGFGNEADRAANVKFALLRKSDGFDFLPNFAVGWNDFYGSRQFHSFYIAMTKEWPQHHVEATLGWGKDRIKGFFGGLAWSPFRKSKIPVVQGLSFLAEYDANNYRDHPKEHPKGRQVSFPVNAGIAFRWNENILLRINSLRGEEFSGLVAVSYNIGKTQGLLPKVDDPKLYTSPVDHEPIGAFRAEKELVQELAFAFCRQGLALMEVYVTTDRENHRNLWLKVINMRYREEEALRLRLAHLLAGLSPNNIFAVTVAVEADGMVAQEYTYRKEDLYRFGLGIIGIFELNSLSPAQDCIWRPSSWESALIYKRRKDPWTLTFRPRLLTFFGSVKGKFKYALGFLGGLEGYFHNQIFYKLQLSYNIQSSPSDIGDMDHLNPSQLPNVRSDTVRYFTPNVVSLEQAFLQKGWSIGKGLFFRTACGYFEPAYAGIAAEMLYFPVNSNIAVGMEAAGLLKRKYQGLGFTTKIRRFKNYTPAYEHFIGYQYFLDFYYLCKPLNIDFKAMAGSFLARDLGIRFELTKNYSSGLRVSLWYTMTNAKDKVNGENYNDKGILFQIPLDFFLKQSSRNYVGYGMSAWLRDVGAVADTGKTLWETIRYERLRIF